MSLYLNLKLIHQNYYEDSSVLPIMSEVSLIVLSFSLQKNLDLDTELIICFNE